jgi:hypothetical protein
MVILLLIFRVIITAYCESRTRGINILLARRSLLLLLLLLLFIYLFILTANGLLLNGSGATIKHHTNNTGGTHNYHFTSKEWRHFL